MKTNLTHTCIIGNIILFAVLLTSCMHSPVVQEENMHMPTGTKVEDSSNAVLNIVNKRVVLGDVKQNQTVTGSYILKNTGNATLVIDYINPDCTCTGFSLTKKQILPGDSARLVLKMSTKDKEGEVAIHATISANTATRLYQVSLLANVL